MAFDLDWMISVDDHVHEPPHVWVDRLPRRFQDEAPRVVRDDEGEAWVFLGVRRPTMGLVATAGKDVKDYSTENITYDDMRPGCYDPVARLDDMDVDGVLASLCFPSFPRFCGQVFSECADRDLGMACLQAYNDWMIEEWCGAAPGRFIPLVLIPLWDPRLAVDEMSRCAAKGAKAVSFSENPSKLGWPSIHDPGRYWDPVFAAAEETGMPLCTHIGSSSQFPQTSEDAPPLVSFTTGPLSNAAACLSDWLWSGNLQRFPRLKICLSEGSIGWIPYVLERAEQVFHHHRAWGASGEYERDPWTGFWVKRAGTNRHDVDEISPRRLFADHVYGCFFEDEHGVGSLDDIGVDNVMVETDYPHSDSPWPHSMELVQKHLQGRTEEEKWKVLQGNARRVFQFEPADPPPARRG